MLELSPQTQHRLNTLIACEPKQLEEIRGHNQKVAAVLTAHLINGIYFQNPQPEAFQQTLLAAEYHDLGKVTVPNGIHIATKTSKIEAEHHEFIYRFHPVRSIALLGREFVLQNPLAAALIFYHHPEQPMATKHQGFLGIPSETPDNEEFRFCLAALIAADGITSGYAIRYGRTEPATEEYTTNFLQDKFTKHNLNGVLNIPLAVSVGYQTLKQLGS